MKHFKTTTYKTDKLKWIIYILLGIGLLTYIKFSNWDIVAKFLISIPLIINLIFDFFYLWKSNYLISELTFETDAVTIIDSKKNSIKILTSDLQFSIRKEKFEKDKTEIELKTKKTFGFRTFGRLHIKNWNETIFNIEDELNNIGMKETNWEPQTLWRKYWPIFIELFSLIETFN